MGLQCGIVGLPNVGKSTIFNALTASSVPAENYPFCTIEPHVGIVSLDDTRLVELARIFKSEKIVPATAEFIDIAGLVQGASKGEGLGNRFLAQIRQVGAIIHVVRCFENENISHVEKTVDPVRDAELIETELLLADLETIQKRWDKTVKAAKTGDKDARIYQALLARLLDHCNQGRRVRTFKARLEEKTYIRSLFLLTEKPILYVANVDEKEIIQEQRSPAVQRLFDFAEREGNSAIRLCGLIEEEIAPLTEEEKKFFIDEYHTHEPGLKKLVRAGFDLLNLHTFYTGGEKEARAWTIPKNATAWEAAGEIHSDFQRGFIKAEVFPADELIRLGSEKAVREEGSVHQEGRDYIVSDNDCIYFKFNV